MAYSLLIYTIAGLGAGISTGLAGLSAAAIITPMLTTILGFNAYEAIGIALASDVLASAVSAYTYYKNKNIDIRNGLVMLVTTLIFTAIGSFLASLVSQKALGDFSVYMTLLLGIKFIVKPVIKTEENTEVIESDELSIASDVLTSAKNIKTQKYIKSAVAGCVVGFICGFIGAGGGMMMLIILTSVLGYSLKTAVGTSVFIMSFTAFTGATSHMVIGGLGDIVALITCVVTTLLGAWIASKFANKATQEKLNRVTGGVLVILGALMLSIKFFG